jgi:hypothetical protein
VGPTCSPSGEVGPHVSPRHGRRVGAVRHIGFYIVEPPASITIAAEGFAEPKAAKEQDPVALEAKATKAAERAQRAAEQAQKLAEQVERLKAQQPAPPAAQPAPKGRKAKAA